MIIKNPYRITEPIGVDEPIPTASGVVSGLEWCRAEAQRLCARKIPAKAVVRGGVCYVVRNAEGCKMDPEDRDLVGAAVAPAGSADAPAPASGRGVPR